MSADPKPAKRVLDLEALKRKLDSDPRCRMCANERATDPHHVVLKSQGGDDVEDNIVPLGRECHRRYHAGRGWIPLTKSETSYLVTKKRSVESAAAYCTRRRLVPAWI